MRMQKTPTRAGFDVKAYAQCRRRPLALGLALALTFATPAIEALAGSIPTTQELQKAWADPRLRDLDALGPIERIELARAYGLQAFLPALPTTAVSNCNDSGAGSLRGAVALAASGDIIDLRDLPCSTITLTSGQIEVTQDSLAVIGAGPHALALRSGNGTKYANRVFNHAGTGNFVLEGMTVSDGIAAGSTTSRNAYGGCINSAGTLLLGNPLFSTRSYGVDVKNCRAVAVSSDSVDGRAGGGGVSARQVIMSNSTVSGCSISGPAFGNGGGVFAYSRLAMNMSELSDNHSTTGTKYGGGGAAAGYLQGSYSLILNSTIAGNTASRGGGLAFSGDAVIRNSTISGNTSAARGGGIYMAGVFDNHLTLSGSTITANVVTSGYPGGGVTVYANATTGGGVDLESTIIAGNFRANSVADDLGGNAAFVGANNLVGFSGPQTPALPPDTLIGADPQLGPLAYNGGPTRTHALRPGSAAIGTGNNVAAQDHDQRGRGFARVVGEAPDIGAFELDPDRIFVDDFDD